MISHAAFLLHISGKPPGDGPCDVEMIPQLYIKKHVKKHVWINFEFLSLALFPVMLFLDIILCILLLQGSFVNSVAQISGLNSRDTFDSSTDFSEVSLDPILFLDDSMQSGLSLASPPISIASADPLGIEFENEPGTGLDVTSLNSNDLVMAANIEPIDTMGYCSSQSRKRKRNVASCPIQQVPTSLGLYGDDDSELPLDAEIPSATENKFPECEERIFGLGRIFDVCCKGPLGPYGIDGRARLIYNWIRDCRLGMPSMVSIRVVKLTAIDCKGTGFLVFPPKNTTPVVDFGW